MTILRKLNFHLFELNTNVTTMEALSPEMKTFYDRALLKCAEPELVHDQFAQTRDIPKGAGKTIEFRKFSSLPKALTALTEGLTPDGQAYSVTAITATVKQYGAYIAISDVLQLTAFDNNMAEITRILGSQAGRTADTITREVMRAECTNIQRPNSKLSVDDITATDVLTVDEIKKAVNTLKNANASKINGSWVAIVHPDAVYDLMKDEEWIEASKYAGSDQIFKGEIGKLYGVRFVESTEARIEVNGGGASVYTTFVLGANAYGTTKVAGGGLQTIVKQLGSGGTADPLNQRATIGWKMIKTAKVLAPEFMVAIEHGATISHAAN